jgi:hypothetical protein
MSPKRSSNNNEARLAAALLPLLLLLLLLCLSTAAAAFPPTSLETTRAILLDRAPTPTPTPLAAPAHHHHHHHHDQQQNCTLAPLINHALALHSERLAVVAEQRRALERDVVSGAASRAQRALEKTLERRRASVAAAETAQRAAAERGDWASSAELGVQLKEARAAAGRAAAAAADAYSRRGRLAEVVRALNAVEAEAEIETADALDSAVAEAEALADKLLSEAKQACLMATERRERAAAQRKGAQLRAGAASLRLTLSRAHELAERATARAAESAAESDEHGRGLVAALALRDLALGRASGVAAEAQGASTPVKQHADLAAALGEYKEAEDLRRAAVDLEVAEAKGAGAGAALAMGAAEAERKAREHAREHALRLARLRDAARTAERLLDLSREALGVELGGGGAAAAAR